MLFQDFRIFLAARRGQEQYAVHAWLDVDVQVKHDLPAGRLVELLDGDAVGLERFHACGCDLVRGARDMGEIIRRDVENAARRRLRNDQRMPRAARHDVKERESMSIVVDLVAGQFAAQDFREDVVGIVIRHLKSP